MAAQRSVVRDIVQTVIGPGTFQPWPVFWIVLLCMFVRTGSLANTFAQTGDYRQLVLMLLLQSLVVATATACFFVAIPWCFERVRPAKGPAVGQFRYLLVVIIVASLATATLMIVHRVVLVPPMPASFLFRPLAGAIPANFLFVLPILLVSNGVASKVYERARRNEVVLRSELETVRMERIALIAAEERVRHEIARTLHDDVQSELLRAAVRLSTVGKNLPPAEQEVVRVALAEIEHAREQGVRSAGRRLAPALAALGLLAALRELCLTYAGVLDVEIESEEHFRERFLRTDDEDPVAIAVYRAVEQGLQNAVQHGRARTGFLRLSVVPPGLVQLQLLTDGALLDANWRPGLGSTVISAWTEAVGGAWTLVPGDEAGAVLTATFGRPPS